MVGLYDATGMASLRCAGLDREACLAYASLFGLSLASCLAYRPCRNPSPASGLGLVGIGIVEGAQQLKPSRQIFPVIHGPVQQGHPVL